MDLSFQNQFIWTAGRIIFDGVIFEDFSIDRCVANPRVSSRLDGVRDYNYKAKDNAYY